jgi:DNA polymerase-1
MGEDRVYLVDASIYICHAWFSLPLSITDRDGYPANALSGLMDFVTRLLSKSRPLRIAFVFDESLGASFRKQIYPLYKANRPSAPLALKRQFRLCRDFVRALGCLELGNDWYEADDLIGALSVSVRAQGYPVTIISGDKDLTQLLHDNDLWWDFTKGTALDAVGVEKRFGVRPRQIADLFAIAGDRIDNIPGVPVSA